jgi:hypothetical protein
MITIQVWEIRDVEGLMKQLAEHASTAKCTITLIPGNRIYRARIKVAGPRFHVSKLLKVILPDEKYRKLSDFVVKS